MPQYARLDVILTGKVCVCIDNRIILSISGSQGSTKEGCKDHRHSQEHVISSYSWTNDVWRVSVIMQVQAAIQAAEESAGPVDLLVACAGVYRGSGKHTSASKQPDIRAGWNLLLPAHSYFHCTELHYGLSYFLILMNTSGNNQTPWPSNNLSVRLN